MYLVSGSFDMEVYIWVYIWKYLDYNLEPRFTFYIFNCEVGLKWNSCAGTLTTKRVVQLSTLYMRAHIYATVYVVRNNFFPKFGRMYGTCMHPDKLLFHTCIVPPLINHLLGYVTLIHYDFVSWKLHMLLVRWQHRLEVRVFCWCLELLPCFGESCTMRGITNRPSITGMKYT